MNWLFVPYVLQLLSRGVFFRNIFFYLFRAVAVITALVGLIVCAGLLKTVINLPAVGVIGGFVFIALTIVAFYVVSHIYWIRAADIQKLSDAKFTMIPIYAIMVRTVGEVLASFVAVMSVGGFILLLFAPQEAVGMLSGLLPMGPMSMMMDRGGNSFIEALVILVGGSIYAVLLLAVFYLIAEFIVALAEIAINTGVTASNTAVLLSSGNSPATVASPVSVPSIPAGPTNKVCRSCGSPNPRNAAFCENCGNPL
jgi:hypothetical protein